MVTNLEQLAAEADKYFPYYYGYDPERHLPEIGDAVMVLTRANHAKVIEYTNGCFDSLNVYRWWPTKLLVVGGGFVLDTPEKRRASNL